MDDEPVAGRWEPDWSRPFGAGNMPPAGCIDYRVLQQSAIWQDERGRVWRLEEMRRGHQLGVLYYLSKRANVARIDLGELDPDEHKLAWLERQRLWIRLIELTGWDWGQHPPMR